MSQLTATDINPQLEKIPVDIPLAGNMSFDYSFLDAPSATSASFTADLLARVW